MHIALLHDCETYSQMAQEAEPYFPPTSQQHQHRILIYHANGLLGHRLVEYFRNDHIIELNPNLIMGTIDSAQKYANDLGLSLEIDTENRPLLNSAIFQSDIITFPLTKDNTQELDYLLKFLKCLAGATPKKVIVVSSVFEWRNRNANLFFKREDYLQRTALNSVIEELEHLALGINNLNPLITSCVINSGIVYGKGEQILFALFKQALEQKQPLAYYGGGGNHLPLIHVDDLAQFVNDLAFSNSTGFFYAADHSQITQLDLISVISQTIGSGKIEQIPVQSAFMHEDYDIFTADIKIDPRSLPNPASWKYKDGLKCNIGSIVGEFNTSRGLKPNKIFIYGTPASGKSKLAEILAKNYGLPIINVKGLIEDVRNEDSPFANEVKAVLQELRAIKIEEERKIYEETKKKKKGKGMEDFDPTKVAVRLPEQQLCKIVKRRINMADCLNKGCIIDSVLKTHLQLETVFLNEKGELIDAIAPNSVFNLEANEEETKDRVKKLPADVIEGTHWTEEQTLRRIGLYHKQNQSKKWHTFFSGKVDVKQVPFQYTDTAQFIEFIERNGPLGFKAKPKKQERIIQQTNNQEVVVERKDSEQSAEQADEYEEFNLEKLTQSEVKILNEKSRPIRQYLIDNVIPQITEGLLEICKQTPPDPIRFLINFLENKRSKKKNRK